MKLRLCLFLAAISVALAAAPAWTARRPRYGGTLRVEVGASVASLDPDVAAATPEEAATKTEIDALIYDHRNPDGTFAGEAGSGPFRVTTWDAGKRATLTANDGFREGRPFVDAIEITMGRAAHDRLLDLELSKADFAEVPPQEARLASERGVRVSVSQPDELLALFFVSESAAGTTGGQQPRAALVPKNAKDIGQALSLAIDRVAIVNFILQKTGEPAGGLLPQWSSGTAFLFPAVSPTETDLAHAKELWKQIAPSPKLLLGYDSADSLEQSVAERIAVNAREAGIVIRAQGLPNAGARDARGAAQIGTGDLQLVRWRMASPQPASALRSFLARIYQGPLAGVERGAFPEAASAEDIYNQQRAVLSTYRVVPLVWLPQVYGLSARVRDWKTPGPGQGWPLADLWLDAGAATTTGGGPQ
ncbi:MAG: ABC transporter substrate-binding protein [Candidatus Acidiferrales bacterium]